MIQQDPFVANLGYLCGFYPSVAEVCRRLSMNRQQFNKYLGGRVRPSRHNLHRICDFFGVSESEILLEHGHFVALVSSRAQPVASGKPGNLLQHIDALSQNSQPMDRYIGYYYRYFYSFGYPGCITRSLASLYESDGHYYWKNIESRHRAENSLSTSTSRYAGTALFLSDRIFIIEYDVTMQNSITQIVLYPSYHNPLQYLRGIQTGAPTMHGRKPGASVVLLEYLGRDANLFAAMRKTGIFPDHHSSIAPTIRELVENRINPASHVFDIDGIV